MPYAPPEIAGWMDKPALEWLYTTASTMTSIVEIGSWKGRSTHALLSGCPGPVFAIDHFKGNPDERDGAHKEAKERDIFQDFWTNVGQFRNLVVLRMDSARASRYFAPSSIDMVFIDGYHATEAVLLDLVLWRSKCRKLLCGHDAGYNSVREALDIFGLTITENPGGIWSVNV